MKASQYRNPRTTRWLAQRRRKTFDMDRYPLDRHGRTRKPSKHRTVR